MSYTSWRLTLAGKGRQLSTSETAFTFLHNTAGQRPYIYDTRKAVRSQWLTATAALPP